MVTEAVEEVELGEFEEQMQKASTMVQEVIGRMLQEGDIHPHIVVLSVARAAGELMGALAAASDHNLDEVLRDTTEVVHQAAHNHYDELQAMKAELMPVAGNA